MSDHQPESFNIQRLDRQLAASRLARFALIAALIAGWFGSSIPVPHADLLSLGGIIGAIFGWVVANHLSTHTARQTLRISQMLAGGAPNVAIEPQIQLALNRFTLYQSVRGALYHQLALLRRRQGRLDDAAAICIALLDPQRLRLPPAARTKVRLLLADLSLLRGDLLTAWHMLVQLHTDRLELIELLQRIELQTRYEFACGYHRAMLEQLPTKIHLAEIMPPITGAAMHLMLAHAASGCHCHATADWLKERGQLLAGNTDSPEQDFVELGQTDRLAEHG